MRTLAKDLEDKIGTEVDMSGWIDTRRNMGGVSFYGLRDRTGNIQLVTENNDAATIPKLGKNDIVNISGRVVAQENARSGYEIQLTSAEVLSSPAETYPLSIKPTAQEGLNKHLDHRAVSLRNPKVRDAFVLQATLVKAFRDYMRTEGFTEIFTPKIGPKGAEGGSDVFKLQYFESEASLTQSPQIYKQIMVGSGLERVFEVGHAYRAEKHDTTRHLNEYLSLDAEMGFITSFHDILDVHEGLLRYMVSVVGEKHMDILDSYGTELLQLGDKIPRVPLDEMKEVLQSRFKKSKSDGKDIDPEGERLAHQYVKDEYGTDVVFLTHYPRDVRPFYTMPAEDGTTESFDTLMRGLEITTGGQRIHDYQMMLNGMESAGVDTKDFTGYLEAFKYGMPPHGGFGIGAERLTARFLDVPNVRQASLFPRDRKRFSP